MGTTSNWDKIANCAFTKKLKETVYSKTKKKKGKVVKVKKITKTLKLPKYWATDNIEPSYA